MTGKYGRYGMTKPPEETKEEIEEYENFCNHGVMLDDVEYYDSGYSPENIKKSWNEQGELF